MYHANSNFWPIVIINVSYHLPFLTSPSWLSMVCFRYLMCMFWGGWWGQCKICGLCHRWGPKCLMRPWVILGNGVLLLSFKLPTESTRGTWFSMPRQVLFLHLKWSWSMDSQSWYEHYTFLEDNLESFESAFLSHFSANKLMIIWSLSFETCAYVNVICVL